MAIQSTYLNSLIGYATSSRSGGPSANIPLDLANTFMAKLGKPINDPREVPRANLAGFLASVEYNLTNKFEIYINGPLLGEYDYEPDLRFWDRFRYSAESVELPRKSLNLTNYQLNALNVTPLPYQVSYDNVLQIVFRVSRNYMERDAFLKWQELIYPTTLANNRNYIKEGNARIQPNSGLNYYDVYAEPFDISVASLNNRGQTMMLTKFFGVYPFSVEPITYDWGASEYVRQIVNFSFNKFFTQTHKTGE